MKLKTHIRITRTTTSLLLLWLAVSLSPAATTPDDLGTSPPCFVIEAEDYDFEGGQTLPVASIMPYTGGAYDGLAAVLNVDYYNDQPNWNPAVRYRPDSDANHVNLIDNLAGRWGTRRPGYDVVVSYRIGWVYGGEWQNYTRDVPAGTYAVWAALSYADTANHQLRGRLSKVTSGVGTENQNWEDLGTFDAPGSGAWGDNNLVPMQGSDGAPASFAHPGGPVTLRFWLGSGDFDWFALKPVLDFAGFLPPIGGADATGGSFANPLRSFKLKSTIPLKFTASCGGAPVLTGIHTLQAIKWTSQTDSESPIDAKPTDAATTGNQFRLTGSQWHFNLDTRATGMSVGIWQLIATLSDGSQHSVWIQVK